MDGDTAIAEANCVGRSTSSSTYGVKSRAQGLAKAIVNWLASVYPKPREKAEGAGQTSLRWH